MRTPNLRAHIIEACQSLTASFQCDRPLMFPWQPRDFQNALRPCSLLKQKDSLFSDQAYQGATLIASISKLYVKQMSSWNKLKGHLCHYWAHYFHRLRNFGSIEANPYLIFTLLKPIFMQPIPCLLKAEGDIIAMEHNCFPPFSHI